MKFFLILLILSTTGFSQDKVKIHFYAQNHAVEHPSHEVLLRGLLSQLQGLLELHSLVEENPDLPIFDESLHCNKEGVLTRFDTIEKELAENLSELDYRDLLDHTVISLRETLGTKALLSIYAAGASRSLNALRLNQGMKPLNLQPTVIDSDDLNQLLKVKKELKQLACQQTERRIVLVPITYIASTIFRNFYSRFPSPLAVSFVVGTVDYLIGKDQIHKESTKSGLNNNGSELEQYLKMTLRERFVKDQMEKYVEGNPEVKDVYLCFGAKHQFQELQNSDLLEFINPPEITKELVQYQEDFEETLETLQLKSKL